LQLNWIINTGFYKEFSGFLPSDKKDVQVFFINPIFRITGA